MITWHKAKKPIAQLVLAHGAGAGMDSEFMQSMAHLLTKKHINVGLFNFPYMQQAIAEQKRRPPPAAPKLVAYYQQVVESICDPLPLFIGGKSMGGRMASLLVCEPALQAKVQGVIALGYPFHPPKKQDKLRVSHFAHITCPFLVVQGERDTFGSKAELPLLTCVKPAQIHWLADGDHSLIPRKKSGLTQEENWQQGAEIISQFIQQI